MFFLLLTGDFIKGGMGILELMMENENRIQLIAWLIKHNNRHQRADVQID